MTAPVKKTAAARPSLAKKHTRASTQKQDDILNQGWRIVIADEVYQIRAGDLNALHSRALRQQVGITFPGLLAVLASEHVDVDMLAAWIWLHRMANGEDVTYNTVAAETGYDIFDDFAIHAPAQEDDAPEE